MSPFGGRLTKVLAVAAAFMTVAAGKPVVGCVCPDGRIKLFCTGPSPSHCCCPVPATPATPPGTDHRSCKASGQHRACCAGGRSTAPIPGGSEVKGCCCHRAVLAEAASFTPKGEGEEARPSAPVPDALWAFALPGWAVGNVPAARFEVPPPDLTIRFCHFTC